MGKVGEYILNQYDELFEEALHWINFIGSCILLIAVGVALLNFGFLVLQHFTGFQFKGMFFALTQPKTTSLSLDHIKLELSRLVAFSLLLLVAADVLETLLKPMHDLRMEDLYKMALVGAIRTTLAYFLGKEIEEIMHHIAHAEHGHSHEKPSHGTAIANHESTKEIMPVTHGTDAPEKASTQSRNRKRNKQKKP